MKRSMTATPVQTPAARLVHHHAGAAGVADEREAAIAGQVAAAGRQREHVQQAQGGRGGGAAGAGAARAGRVLNRPAVERGRGRAAEGLQRGAVGKHGVQPAGEHAVVGEVAGQPERAGERDARRERVGDGEPVELRQRDAAAHAMLCPAVPLKNTV